METIIEGDDAESRQAAAARRRRVIIAAVIAGALIVLLAVMIARHGHGPKAPVEAAPNVTVIVPGRHEVTASIAATGTISARRDMPVGAAGEGGRVTKVLVEPGDWVKAGQVLATVDRSVQVQQAAADAAAIAQAKANAALAKANLDRARKLIGNGFISQADLDTKRAALASADAQVSVAQAQLRQQQALIGRLDIRAPTGGLVLTRSVEAGQVVGGGMAALFRIASDGAMEVQAHLAEGDLARVRVGSPAMVTPVGTSLKIAGHVWQVSPVIDPNTRQGVARIALPFDRALRPGGFATIEIGGRSSQVPLLPESAVMSDEDGNFVYLVGADDRVEKRRVKVGEVDDRGVSIASGLAGTERVVASAGAFLNPGDKVIPTPAPSPR